jgi:hypothetical protein
MINIIGKSLAVLQFGMSVALMSLAGFMLVTDFDFGWKDPRRIYNDLPGKPKDDNLLVASDLDKAEAAMRKMIRFKEEELYQLGMAQQQLAQVQPWLAKNNIKGMEILERLENGTGTFEIEDLEADEAKGTYALEEDAPKDWGFPRLVAVKRENPINKSYATYLAELRSLDAKIDKEQKDIQDILTAEQIITLRVIGEMSVDGTPARHDDGSIKKPGWYYLTELEMEMQKQLQKEIEYLQPLWLKELVDAQLVVTRRDLLVQRLNELNVKGFLSQSEFLKKQQ